LIQNLELPVLFYRFISASDRGSATHWQASKTSFVFYRSTFLFHLHAHSRYRQLICATSFLDRADSENWR